MFQRKCQRCGATFECDGSCELLFKLAHDNFCFCPSCFASSHLSTKDRPNTTCVPLKVVLKEIVKEGERKEACDAAKEML